MSSARLLLAALGLAIVALGVSDTAAASSGPLDCVPQPEGAKPGQLVDYATYVLFFWDPDLNECVRG